MKCIFCRKRRIVFSLLRKKFISKCVHICFVSIAINFADCHNGYTLDADTPEVKFLLSINTLKTDFIQKQYGDDESNNNKNDNGTNSHGTIIVKKPDNILLEHESGNMRLKIVSVNGNVKMVDKDIKQTTYVDNQYGEIMQFFTKNLKPEKLTLNKKKELCMRFNKMNTDFNACLKLDLEKESITSLSLYAQNESEEEEGERNNSKVRDNSLKMFDIFFKNVKINSYIDDDVFFVKDERIFNDDEI